MKPFPFIIAFLFTINLFCQISEQKNQILHFENEKLETSKFFEVKKEIIGLDNDMKMKLISSHADRSGISHSRYHQYYKNYKIIGGTYILHSKNNKVLKTNGVIYNVKKTTELPVNIDDAKAKWIAESYFKSYLEKTEVINAHTRSLFNIEKISLCYIDKFYPKTSGELLKAYEIILSTTIQHQLYKRAIFVDCFSGSEILGLDKIADHSVPGRGQSNFYNTVQFTHDSIAPDKFYLRDLSRGGGISVYNIETNKLFENNASEWNFDEEGKRSAIDVLFSAEKYYDLLNSNFGYNSIDNNGFPLVANVNKQLYTNAFWDGSSTTFGSGDCHEYHPFTSIDVVGHEFTHGLTQFNSNLDYSRESGALNEAISDIFGKALEYFTFPEKFTWTIGKVFTKPAGKPIRSMSNPKLYDQPSYYKGTNWWTNFFDNYGVHTNSGVLNHWFFLLCIGKNGYNEIGEKYIVKPIGMEKAIDLVFRLNTQYLTETSGYFDAFLYSKEIISDLYGDESEEFLSIIEAWKAVGLTDELIAEQDIDDVLIALLNGRDKVNFRMCEDQLQHLKFTYKNLSNKTIPANTPIHCTISMNYGIIESDSLIHVNDTLINKDIILPYDFTSDSTFEINLSYIPKQNILYPVISAKEILEYTLDGKTYTINTYHGFEVIYNNIDPKDKFRVYQSYIQLENRCSKNSQIEYMNYNIFPETCVNGPQEFILEIVGENKTGEVKIEGNISVGIQNFIIQDVQKYFLLSDYGNSQMAILNLYYEEDSLRYRLKSDTLKSLFSRAIEKDELIDFSQNLTQYQQFMDIDACLICDLEIVGQTLKFHHDYEDYTIDDCVSLDDYYIVNAENRSLSNSSKLAFCVNLSEFIEPRLSFNMQMISKTSLPTKAEYTHAVFPYKNGNLLIDPRVSTTEKKWQHFDLPLEITEELKLNFILYNEGSSTYFDDILVYDNFSTSYDELSDIKRNIWNNNPANDFLTFKSSSAWNSNAGIELFNIKGQKYFSMPLTDNSSEINTSDWPTGIYFYKILNGTEVYWNKVIIVH